jgi:hypothetical protein
MKQILAIPLLLVGFQFATYGDTVPDGTSIEVRTEGPISVSKWDRGRIYVGRVARDVMDRNGNVAVPRGSHVEMIVRQIGDDRMALDFESMTVNGRRYTVDTSGPQFHTNRDYDRGAGLVGNIVGAIAGVDTQGAQIRVPADSILTFRLQQPLRIVDWQDPGYDRDGQHYHRDHDWYR